MREGVRVAGIVCVSDEGAGVEFGAVLEDGGFEFAELGEDEVALFSALAAPRC